MPLAHRPGRRLPSPLRLSFAIASALAAATLPALAAPAPRADAALDAGATRLDGIEVTGERVDKASSPKYTEPLLDTPQAITVVDKATMDQQALFGLRDVLSTLPGITFGAGEGGGGYGDSINLRGFSASADITVDGVRDSAQYTRSDNFNLESLELVNGANSAHSGAGSVGGSINLVSKSARLEDFNVATLGAGTDGFARATVDNSQVLGTGNALRLNAMVHRNDVPDREHEDFRRWGFAPSVGFALDSDTRLTLSAMHQRDDNAPQYGLPYFSAYGGTLPGIDEQAYYGYHNLDRQEIEASTVTAVFEHDFSADVTLRSLARLQRVDQTTVVSAVQGSWCLADGTNPATGGACTGGLAPGSYQPSGPRGYQRDTRNVLAASQTDLSARFDTGAVGHALVAGVAFTRETFDLDTGSLLRNPDGTLVALPVMDLSDPDSTWIGPVNYTLTGRSEGELSNAAVYLFDTMRFGERWLLNLGARYEHNEGSNAAWTVVQAPALGQPAIPGIGTVTGKGPTLENVDDLFSWRAGLVFKPTDAGSVYLSHSNARTPSKASVNGSCTALTCNVDPESASNLELGTKWELHGGRLALSAALFRNERENYKVADFDPLSGVAIEQALDGRARVDGLSLGIAGQLTRTWSVFANATWLDSEVLQSVSDFCLANPGQSGCTNSPANPDPERGLPIVQTPERSASLWTTWAFAPDWMLGYGLSYQDRFRLAGRNYTQAYTVHRAMLGYTVSDALSLQLNINNLLDEDYFVRVRNNGWATPGEARSAMLTATFRY